MGVSLGHKMLHILVKTFLYSGAESAFAAITKREEERNVGVALS